MPPLHTRHRHRLAVTVLAALSVSCAGRGDVAERMAAADAALGEEVASLRLELDAAYDRERAMADRLRRAEEDLAILQAQVAAAGERIDSLGRRPPEAVAATRSAPVPGAPPALDVAAMYQSAYARHQEHDYEGAIAGFGRLLAAAPTHALADNAQYWIGESWYGLGRYREALAAFTRVLAYETTEKDDDAQLMIARSYLALGERQSAITAFRKLLSEHPDSEYAETARRELRAAEGS